MSSVKLNCSTITSKYLFFLRNVPILKINKNKRELENGKKEKKKEQKLLQIIFLELFLAKNAEVEL